MMTIETLMRRRKSLHQVMIQQIPMRRRRKLGKLKDLGRKRRPREGRNTFSRVYKDNLNTSSLCHTLKNNDCFMMTTTKPGMGNFWSLDPQSKNMFDNGMFLR